MRGIKSKIFILLCAILSIGTHPAFSQHYFTEFGQNRIQYKDFDWVFFTTAHFDIYHYDGGSEYARQALDILEVEYNRLTDVLGYAPYTKTKIFIYNSINDLQQSNIGIDGAVFTIGGQTDFVKLQMEIAHPGNAYRFKEELIYKLSRVLIEDMLFGGSLAEIFQSSYLLSLPRWFIDGAARYLAYGWSSDMDDYIRDYLTQNKVKNLIKIDGSNAGIVGQSVWNYIALKYGRSNISNILNLTRIIRNEESSISSALGINYKIFIGDWQRYYTANNAEISTYYNSPDQQNILVRSRNPEIQYRDVRVNPSGTRVAYSQNVLGRYAIYVKQAEEKRVKSPSEDARETWQVDFSGGRTREILKSGIRVKGQQVDYDLPVLDWLDDVTLGMIYYKRGYLILATLNLETGEKFEKPLRQFNQVKSFSFNENGRLAVISGSVDGTNDIFLVSMRRNSLRRITSDIYDDIDPAFIPGTSAIVFSSNRPSDSVKTKTKDFDATTDNFNLFVYDLDTSRVNFLRITNNLSKDYKPLPANPYEIYFLSDQRGITNLFKFRYADSTIVQITKYDKSILDYDIQHDEGALTFLMLDNGKVNVFVDRSVDFDQASFTPQTARQRLKQARLIADKFNKRQSKEILEQKSNNIVISEIKTDPIKDTARLIINTPPPTPRKPGEVDIENYEFDVAPEIADKNFLDTDNFKFEAAEEETPDFNVRYRPESFFSNYQKLEISNRVYGPIPYKPLFSFDNLITSFAIDPLRGFGMVMETKITDMLGNHKINAGTMVITSLNQGDVFAQYEYLKKYVDFKVRLDRKSYYFENRNFDTDDRRQLRQRYNLTTVKGTAALPLSNWLRVEASPFVTLTEFRNQQFEVVANPSLGGFAPDSKQYFGGFNSRMVFDNTVEKGYNILQGSRGSLDFTWHQGIGNQDKSFGNIKLDFRHYQKIHREITLASRIFYGQFFGPNRQNYLAGGIPNWVFNTFENHTGPNPLRIRNSIDNTNLMFTEFVTNIRGFDYNELFGPAAAVFNTELRFPVFQYLSKGPINSTFLRNFILTTFFDVGSAWTGPPPITSDNAASVITYRPPNSVFFAEISNFRNPWLASYGYGLRTVLLGYYIKLDYANPIRDFERQGSRLTLGIGLDF